MVQQEGLKGRAAGGRDEEMEEEGPSVIRVGWTKTKLRGRVKRGQVIMYGRQGGITVDKAHSQDSETPT